jgi:spore germination cell wall hydrolase CwlJ-like protein
MSQTQTRSAVALAGLAMASLGGCAMFPGELTDRECMTRAMYFESNRSSSDGMLAVGTTVMNRLAAPGFPKSVCGVVGQPGQYASGVLTKPMNPRQASRVAEVADSVLAGARHPQVGSAMYFHTAGLSFPYTNMHYVAVAGGNAFYEKLSRREMEARAERATVSPDIVAGRQPETLDDLLRSADLGEGGDPMPSSTSER